jgi:sugar porter (SP) family MFS transporter
MAPAHFRGGLVLLNAIAITGGEAISFLVDYLLVPTHSWRLMFLSGLIPAVLLFVGMLFLPSTPRWMVLKGLLSEAYRTLANIRRTSQVRPEFKAIKQSFEAPVGTWRQLFSKRLRPVLIIGLFLGVLQQFVGINTVMYYGPTIFANAGFNNASTQVLATLIMGVVNTVVSILAVIMVDILGRRSLLITGLVMAGISLIIIGLDFVFKINSHTMHWLTIIFMMVYIAGYCISVGSLFWLIISEIYPLQARGLAMSFVTAVQWLANFIVAVSFLSLLNVFGSANTFWFFGFICLLGAIIAYFIVPETKGVSLEQIENNLNHGKAKRDLGMVA